MTPLYPLLLAGVFKILGVYTQASALAMLSFDSLFSALMRKIITGGPLIQYSW